MYSSFLFFCLCVVFFFKLFSLYDSLNLSETFFSLLKIINASYYNFWYFKFESIGSRDEWFASAQKHFIDRPKECFSKVLQLGWSLYCGWIVTSPLIWNGTWHFKIYYHLGFFSNSGTEMYQSFVPIGKSSRNIILGEIDQKE